MPEATGVCGIGAVRSSTPHRQACGRPMRKSPHSWDAGRPAAQQVQSWLCAHVFFSRPPVLGAQSERWQLLDGTILSGFSLWLSHSCCPFGFQSISKGLTVWGWALPEGGGSLWLYVSSSKLEQEQPGCVPGFQSSLDREPLVITCGSWGHLCFYLFSFLRGGRY